MAYKQPFMKTPDGFMKKGDRKVRVAEIADTVTDEAKSNKNYVKSKSYQYVENGQKKTGVKNIYKIPKSELETTTLPGGKSAKKTRKQTVVKNIFDTAMSTGIGLLTTLYGKSINKDGL